MIRIALIDGDKAIRTGRRLMIESQSNLQIVYEEEDAAVALTKLPDLLIDVAIIDYRLKGFDGVSLTRRYAETLAARGERLPRVIITGPYLSDELLEASKIAGATSVITQDEPMSKLLESIIS